MKNVIISGATGMIGNLVLLACLEKEDVELVTVISRHTTGLKHPKLTEVICDNFLNLSSLEKHFKNQDICFYCLGVYTGKVSQEKFKEITVEYTKAWAETLRKNSKQATICYLSGQGAADPEDRNAMMFARDKGAAEKLLTELQFDQAYLFRPGYIYPVTPRIEPNFMYTIMRWIYKPVLSKLSANLSIPSNALAMAMMHVGFHGWRTNVLENRDIRDVARESQPQS